MFPDNELRRLDHTSMMIRDLDALGAVAERIGFSLSPLMGAPDPIIENRIVAFEDEGLDFMTILKRGVLPGDLDGILDAREGLFCLVFRVDEKEKVVKAEEALKAFGCETLLVEGGRPEVQQDGTIVRPEWTMCGGYHPTMFFLRVCVCCHYDLDLFFRPERKSHANGAIRTARIIAAARDLAHAEDMAAFLFGRDNLVADGASIRARLDGDVIFEIFSPDALQDAYETHVTFEGHDIYMVGQEIRVARLSVLSDHLKKNDVPYRTLESGKLLIPPAVLGNVAWTFVE